MNSQRTPLGGCFFLQTNQSENSHRILVRIAGTFNGSVVFTFQYSQDAGGVNDRVTFAHFGILYATQSIGNKLAAIIQSDRTPVAVLQHSFQQLFGVH